MARQNNYLIQATQAKELFLTYDQQQLIRKFRLEADENYFYVNLLSRPYRLNRKNGDLEYREAGVWRDGNSFEEVMTLLDMLCDSKDHRRISGRWQNMLAFGLQFHRNLMEDQPDPLARRIHREPEHFRQACHALGGCELGGADISYALELFDGLPVAIQFWHGDEEFEPRLRYLWDENARMYIRYETMYFAVDLLKRRLEELM